MKKIIVLGGFALSFLMVSCGGSDESATTISETEKAEIIKLEEETKKLEEQKADIDASTKELEELLEEL